jgi:hypothetical protein
MTSNGECLRRAPFFVVGSLFLYACRLHHNVVHIVTTLIGSAVMYNVLQSHEMWLVFGEPVDFMWLSLVGVVAFGTVMRTLLRRGFSVFLALLMMSILFSSLVYAFIEPDARTNRAERFERREADAESEQQQLYKDLCPGNSKRKVEPKPLLRFESARKEFVLYDSTLQMVEGSIYVHALLGMKKASRNHIGSILARSFSLKDDCGKFAKFFPSEGLTVQMMFVPLDNGGTLVLLDLGDFGAKGSDLEGLMAAFVAILSDSMTHFGERTEFVDAFRSCDFFGEPQPELKVGIVTPKNNVGLPATFCKFSLSNLLLPSVDENFLKNIATVSGVPSSLSKEVRDLFLQVTSTSRWLTSKLLAEFMAEIVKAMNRRLKESTTSFDCIDDDSCVPQSDAAAPRAKLARCNKKSENLESELRASLGSFRTGLQGHSPDCQELNESWKKSFARILFFETGAYVNDVNDVVEVQACFAEFDDTRRDLLFLEIVQCCQGLKSHSWMTTDWEPCPRGCLEKKKRKQYCLHSCNLFGYAERFVDEKNCLDIKPETEAPCENSDAGWSEDYLPCNSNCMKEVKRACIRCEREVDVSECAGKLTELSPEGCETEEMNMLVPPRLSVRRIFVRHGDWVDGLMTEIINEKGKIEKRAFLGSRDGGSLSIVEPGIDDCITLVHEYTDPSWTLTAWTLYAIRFEVRNFSCNLLDLNFFSCSKSRQGKFGSDAYGNSATGLFSKQHVHSAPLDHCLEFIDFDEKRNSYLKGIFNVSWRKMEIVKHKVCNKKTNRTVN